MLPNHAPLVVAEQFGTLAALYPGRIDLGLGRAPGTDRMTAAALRRSAEQLGPDDFPEQLGELGLLPGRRVPRRAPVPGNPLGAARRGHAADLAARLQPLQRRAGRHPRPAVRVRAPLQRDAHPAGPGALPLGVPPVGRPRRAVRDRHRAGRSARPTTTRPTASRCPPRCRSCGCVRAGPGSCRRPSRPRPTRGRRRSGRSSRQRRDGQAIGGPETVRAALADLLSATAADELMLSTLVHAPADRIRSTELIRGLFGDVPAGLAPGGRVLSPSVGQDGRVRSTVGAAPWRGYRRRRLRRRGARRRVSSDATSGHGTSSHTQSTPGSVAAGSTTFAGAAAELDRTAPTQPGPAGAGRHDRGRAGRPAAHGRLPEHRRRPTRP